jgi:hypothetical protein
VDREKHLGNLEERGAMFTWTTSRDAGSMTTSNEGERMPRIWNGTLRRTNLILLAFMFLVVTMAQAQDSLEALKKRKTIAEAEKEAIQAETARDEARKKQSELAAPLDPVQKAKDDAVEAANSAKAITDAKKAQSDAQSLCTQCIQAAQEEVKKCLDGAISQEDKKSCLEKQETRTKTCSNGECKIERAQSGEKNDGLPEKK